MQLAIPTCQHIPVLHRDVNKKDKAWGPIAKIVVKSAQKITYLSIFGTQTAYSSEDIKLEAQKM